MHETDENGRPIPSTFNYDLWVCSLCMKPSRMVFENLTNSLCPKRATSLLSAHGHGDGRWTLRWATEVAGEAIETMTFNAYPRKMNNMDQGRGVCVELWERMDSHIDNIRSGQIGPDTLEMHKAQATELSQVIALIMSPFYADSTAVLQESMNRWQARQDGVEHESPGLAEHNWNPPTMAYAPAGGSGGAIGKVNKPKVEFDDAKKNFIIHCLNNGIQTPATLAKMFSCSEDDIKAVVDNG